jgi:hypothetical protein
LNELIEIVDDIGPFEPATGSNEMSALTAVTRGLLI